MAEQNDQVAKPRYVPPFKPLDMKHVRTVAPNGQPIERKSYYTTGRSYFDMKGK